MDNFAILGLNAGIAQQMQAFRCTERIVGHQLVVIDRLFLQYIQMLFVPAHKQALRQNHGKENRGGCQRREKDTTPPHIVPSFSSRETAVP